MCIRDRSGEDWPSMNRQIMISNISKYKSLVFSAKGTTSLNLMLESNDGKTQEIRLFLDEKGGTYIWDLSDKKSQEILANIHQALIFAGPGSNTEKAEFEISKLEFTTEAAKGNNVVQAGGDNIAINKYDGTSATLDINGSCLLYTSPSPRDS